MIEIIIVTVASALVLVAMGMEIQQWLDRRRRRGIR